MEFVDEAELQKAADEPEDEVRGRIVLVGEPMGLFIAEELGELFGEQARTPEQVLALARRAQRRGARNVLVSMGADGALLAAEDGAVYHARLRSAQPVVSTVGAGDSVTAGFLAGYLDSGEYEYALRLGVACGSATAYSECLANAEKIREVWRSVEVSRQES